MKAEEIKFLEESRKCSRPGGMQILLKQDTKINKYNRKINNCSLKYGTSVYQKTAVESTRQARDSQYTHLTKT